MPRTKKSAAPLPRAKNRQEAEERLLKAAELVFSQHGFNGATTRMIAAEAELNISLITRYFGSKYGLLLRIVAAKRRRLFDSLLPYQPQESLTEECVRYALFRFEQLSESVGFIRILFTQFLTDPTFLKLYQESQFSMLLQNSELTQRVEKLISSGRSSIQLCPHRLIEILEQHIMGIIVLQMVIKGQPVEELRVDLIDFVRTLMKGSDCVEMFKP
ncbi:MAG: TetR/AcrR family transcriptional regulator [Chitinophagaceae bacterium]|nr:TetR/AcrR family transcriptional regulator [Oligoflexus sp.]